MCIIFRDQIIRLGHIHSYLLAIRVKKLSQVFCKLIRCCGYIHLLLLKPHTN